MSLEQLNLWDWYSESKKNLFSSRRYSLLKLDSMCSPIYPMLFYACWQKCVKSMEQWTESDSGQSLQPLAMFSQEQLKASQPFQDADQNFQKRSQYVCHQKFNGKQSDAATVAGLCFHWVGSEETRWALVMEQTGLLCRSFLFFFFSSDCPLKDRTVVQVFLPFHLFVHF